MKTSATLATVTTLVLALGCAARPAAAPPAEARSAATTAPAANDGPASVGPVFIWGSEGNGPPVTYLVDATNDLGAVLGSEAGIVIAARGGEWTWKAEEVEVPTQAWCGPGPAPAGGGGKAIRASMVLRGAGRSEPVVARALPSTAYEVNHEAKVLGSVGPYLFIHESLHTLDCKAEDVGSFFSVWSAVDGKMVNLLDELKGVDRLELEGQRLLNEHFEWQPLVQSQAQFEVARRALPHPVELQPAYEAGGKLTLDVLMVRKVDFGSWDGAWGKGAQSTVVKGVSVPRRLGGYEVPPAAVRGFARAHPRFAMRGWSRR